MEKGGPGLPVPLLMAPILGKLPNRKPAEGEKRKSYPSIVQSESIPKISKSRCMGSKTLKYINHIIFVLYRTNNFVDKYLHRSI